MKHILAGIIVLVEKNIEKNNRRTSTFIPDSVKSAQKIVLRFFALLIVQHLAFDSYFFWFYFSKCFLFCNVSSTFLFCQGEDRLTFLVFQGEDRALGQFLNHFKAFLVNFYAHHGYFREPGNFQAQHQRFEFSTHSQMIICLFF